MFKWQERKQKEQKKNENWQIKVCEKISMEQNFPNDEIIGIYLSNNQGNFIGKLVGLYISCHICRKYFWYIRYLGILCSHLICATDEQV